jgi:hypothetical protein
MDGQFFEVANWSLYQHYRERNPPWVKLHYALLSGETWVALDDASRVLAVACILIASRHDGRVPANPVYIQRVAYLNQPPDFKPLVDTGFLVDASGLLAACKRDASTMLDQRQRRDRGESETEAEESENSRTRAHEAEPYRWADFAAIYPSFRLSYTKAAMKWWRKHAKDDATVDAILAGVRAWLESEQWQGGIVPNCGKFLEGEVWRTPAPPRKLNRQEQLEAHNRAVTQQVLASIGGKA